MNSFLDFLVSCWPHLKTPSIVCLCVTGVQQTEVVCMKVTGVQVVVTDENCDPGLRPTGRTVTCNNTPCPPAYVFFKYKSFIHQKLVAHKKNTKTNLNKLNQQRATCLHISQHGG